MLFYVSSHTIYPVNVLDVNTATVGVPYKAIADCFHCAGGEPLNHFVELQVSLQSAYL